MKKFWSERAAEIPSGWRVCGEHMFAKHSIEYDNLPSYFLGFSIWNDHNECLSWDDTLEWFNLLNIEPVPILYDGVYNEESVRLNPVILDQDLNKHEGYVLRVADSFTYDDFYKSVMKFVRKNHVQTTDFWMHGEVVQNKVNPR